MKQLPTIVGRSKAMLIPDVTTFGALQARSLVVIERMKFAARLEVR
jgi:hypothetical protein